MAQSRGMTTLFFDLGDHFDPMMKILNKGLRGRLGRALLDEPLHTLGIGSELVMHLDGEMGG